jgi:hypothetical protein
MNPTIRPNLTSPLMATGLIIARDVLPLKMNAYSSTNPLIQ